MKVNISERFNDVVTFLVREYRLTKKEIAATLECTYETLRVTCNGESAPDVPMVHILFSKWDINPMYFHGNYPMRISRDQMAEPAAEYKRQIKELKEENEMLVKRIEDKELIITLYSKKR